MNFFGYVNIPLDKNKRLYQVLLPIGAPYEECKEVLHEYIQAIDDLIKAEAEALKAKETATENEASVV